MEDILLCYSETLRPVHHAPKGSTARNPADVRSAEASKRTHGCCVSKVSAEEEEKTAESYITYCSTVHTVSESIKGNPHQIGLFPVDKSMLQLERVLLDGFSSQGHNR